MNKNSIELKLTWFALVLSALVFSSETHARKSGFGLGVIIGEPTGPTFKVWTGANTAIDGAVAWSLDGNDDLHLHADYLIHDFGIAKVEKGSFPLYYGIGGRIRFHDGNQDDQVGVRVPVGMAYLFANSPLELFFEVVPIVDLAPDTELDFNGGVGVRYYFGK
jgi:hypothetical protein